MKHNGALRAQLADSRTAARSAAVQVSFLGDAKSSLGEAKSSLGEAKSSLGDAKSSLGEAKSSRVETAVAVKVTVEWRAAGGGGFPSVLSKKPRRQMRRRRRVTWCVDLPQRRYKHR